MAKLEYTHAVGDAGQAYLDELVRGPDGVRGTGGTWLPATFRWSELFERMQDAATAEEQKQEAR